MDIFYEIGAWVYVVGAIVLLGLLLLFLWFRVRLNSKKIDRDLKILESQYQDKFMEEHRAFIEKQESYIQERLNELDKKELGLSKALSTIEEENIKKLHILLERFEQKISEIQDVNDRENERRIQAIQEKYENKIKALEEKNERETETLKKERMKILQELEEYQRDLQKKSKDELEKIREKHEEQMKTLQRENNKLLDEMQRMLGIRQKAKQPPPPLPRALPPREPESNRFSEESLNQIENQIKSTTEEMEKLKNQFIDLEKKRQTEFEMAQSEIELLKFKIRHGEMKG